MNKNLSCNLETGVCGEEADGVEEFVMDEALTKARIYFYTDPICSACWAIEPLIKRFEAEYGHRYEMSHNMGGLLPGWEYFRDAGNGISKPSDVAHHWEEVAVYTHMPIDGGVWFEDPLDSSFPPSIAFKAAQLQSEELANRFLRRIREWVFLDRVNIAKDEVLLKAAVEVGLDGDRFLNDFRDPKTQEAFQQEMAMGRQMGVRGFPCVIFVNEEGKGVRVPGIQPYAMYVKALEQILGESVQPRPVNLTALSAVEKYGYVATEEVAVVLNVASQAAEKELDALAADGKIEKVPVKHGVFWRARA